MFAAKSSYELRAEIGSRDRPLGKFRDAGRAKYHGA
jgi:hypothetical protein